MQYFLIFTLFTSFNAFANTQGATNTTGNQLALELSQTTNVAPDLNSKQNREDKKYNINFAAGKELGLNALSAEVNYLYEPTQSMYLKYSKMDKILAVGFESGAAIKVGVTKYTGNSFFYKMGAYHMSLNAKHFEKDGSGHKKKVKSVFNELGVSASIGNQWQWSNLSLGAEWIGLKRTVVELRKISEPFERTNLTTVSLLNMQIGYSF
jgi:hypothetical protein